MRTEKQECLKRITFENDRITKSPELLLYGDLDSEDYKSVKAEGEKKLLRLEAKLNELMSNITVPINTKELINKAINNFEKLDIAYGKADIGGKKNDYQFALF